MGTWFLHQHSHAPSPRAGNRTDRRRRNCCSREHPAATTTRRRHQRLLGAWHAVSIFRGHCNDNGPGRRLRTYRLPARHLWPTFPRVWTRADRGRRNLIVCCSVTGSGTHGETWQVRAIRGGCCTSETQYFAARLRSRPHKGARLPLDGSVYFVAIAGLAGSVFTELESEILPTEDRGKINMFARGPAGVGLPTPSDKPIRSKPFSSPIWTQGLLTDSTA